MKKVFIFILICGMAKMVSAAEKIVGEVDCEQGQPEIKRVKAIVQKARDAMAKDMEGTKKAITDKSKNFMDGSIYVHAYKGTTCIAHGYNDKLVGKDLGSFRGPDNVPIVDTMAKIIKARGEGCALSLWPNPDLGGKVATKFSYVLKVKDDIFVGAGFYQAAAK